MRKNILSNFVSVELEQGERLGVLAGWGVNPSSGVLSASASAKSTPHLVIVAWLFFKSVCMEKFVPAGYHATPR